MQSFDVHDFEANGLAADFASLKALGFRNLVCDYIDSDLLQFVIDRL